MKYNFLLLILIICSCGSSSESDNSGDDQTLTPVVQRAKELPLRSEFIVGVDNLRLRAEPGRDGVEVARLPESTVVIPTGEVSDFKSQLPLRGMPYDENWIEVQTGQLKGWVFGGALDFDPGSSQMNQKMFQERLRYLFGTALADEVQAYHKDLLLITKAEELKASFEKCQTLQGRLNKVLEQKVKFDGAYPKLIWMQKGIPGLRSRPVAEGTGLQFFQDYNTWEQWADGTNNAADNQFFKWLEQYNGSEGIESQFTSYFYQMTDYEGQSELGEGKHLDLLKKAETFFGDQTLFSNLYKPYVDKILNDILSQEVTYRNTLSAIDAELSQIISGSWSVISTEQLAALQKRQLDFKNHEQKKILLNGKNIR